jgi:hypothetical protein
METREDVRKLLESDIAESKSRGFLEPDSLSPNLAGRRYAEKVMEQFGYLGKRACEYRVKEGDLYCPGCRLNAEILMYRDPGFREVFKQNQDFRIAVSLLSVMCFEIKVAMAQGMTVGESPEAGGVN